MSDRYTDIESFKSIIRDFLSAIEGRKEARDKAGRLTGKAFRDHLQILDGAETSFINSRDALEASFYRATASFPVDLVRATSDFLEAFDLLTESQAEATRLTGKPFRDFQVHLAASQNEYEKKLSSLKKMLGNSH